MFLLTSFPPPTPGPIPSINSLNYHPSWLQQSVISSCKSATSPANPRIDKSEQWWLSALSLRTKFSQWMIFMYFTLFSNTKLFLSILFRLHFPGRMMMCPNCPASPPHPNGMWGILLGLAWPQEGAKGTGKHPVSLYSRHAATNHLPHPLKRIMPKRLLTHYHWCEPLLAGWMVGASIIDGCERSPMLVMMTTTWGSEHLQSPLQATAHRVGSRCIGTRTGTGMTAWGQENSRMTQQQWQ